MAGDNKSNYDLLSGSLESIQYVEMFHEICEKFNLLVVQEEKSWDREYRMYCLATVNVRMKCQYNASSKVRISWPLSIAIWRVTLLLVLHGSTHHFY